MAGLRIDAVLACGNVYNVDLWLGESQDDADAHSINCVFTRHTSQSFYWHVHWSAYTPDGSQCFFGETWDVTSNELLEPGQWYAAPSARTKSGAAWWNPHVSSGWKTIKARVKRTGGPWCWSEGVEMGITEVELEKLAAGNSPDLDMGVVCINAQSCYKKAKWKAKKVIPDGTTARVVYWGKPVTFSGIGGSDPSDLSEGETFWAETVGTEPGTYHINLIHNDEVASVDTDSGTIFKFEFDWIKTNTTENESGDGIAFKEAGTVYAHKDTAPGGQLNGAQVYWYYDMKVVTDPTGLYSGKVDATAKVAVETDGIMTIRSCPLPEDPQSTSVCVNFGMISACSGSASGTDPYPGCVAAAEVAIRIDSQPEAQSGEAKRDVWNVPPFEDWHMEKTWPSTPDMSHNSTDMLRTWTVGTTEIEFYVRLAASSDADRICGSEGCPGSIVQTNYNRIDSVEVEEDTGSFDIVP